jgi:hypothetical protein
MSLALAYYEHTFIGSGSQGLIDVLKNGLRYEELLEDISIPFDDPDKFDLRDA